MKSGALLKWGILKKGVISKGWPKRFCSEMFLQRTGEAESSYENLMISPNY
jgi:hypothetical protein